MQRFTSLLPSLALAVLAVIGCDSEPAGPEGDPDAEIVILSPKGGETWYVGDSVDIKWALQGRGIQEVNGVNLELSIDSGKAWLGLLKGSLPTTERGSYRWGVPGSLVKLGVTYDLTAAAAIFLRISQYSTADPNKIVVSKKPFKIRAR